MDPDERDSVATQFGVSAEQVERDHLISHILAFLSREFGDRVHFIGGTALARTHLPDGRLSEDIDLIAIGSRKEVANELDATLPRAVARSHGRLTVETRLKRYCRHPAGAVASFGRTPSPAAIAIGTRPGRLADGTPRSVSALCGRTHG